MASWKKILVDGDNTNLATTDLTQTAGTDRVYLLADDNVSSLEIKAESGTGIKISNTGTDSVKITGPTGLDVLDSNGGDGGRVTLREGSNNGGDGIAIIAPDSVTTGGVSLTLPSTGPTAAGQVLSGTSGNASTLSWVDNKNIGDSNLDITDSARTLDLAASGRLSIRESDHDLVAQFEEGVVTLAGAVKIVEDGAATQGEIRLSEGGPSDNYVALKAYPTMSGDHTLTLPASGAGGTKLLKVDSGGQIGYSDIPTSYDLRVEDDGVLVYNTPGTINFTGSGVTVTNPSGSEVQVAITGGSGSTSPGGSDTYIQYNDGGSFGGDSAFFFNDGSEKSVHTTGVFYANNIAVEDAQIPATTVGAYGRGSRILYKAGGITGSGPAGRIMYNNNGTTGNASNSSQATASGMLFVGTDAGTSDELLLEGIIRVSSNNGFSSAAEGTPLYLGSSGDAVAAAPQAVRRLVGYVWDASDKLIYFKPDNTWIT